MSGADIIGYGTKENAFARAENISYSAQGAEFDVTLSGETIHLKTKLLGAHNVINITGAVALAKELGVKNEDIAYAVSRLEQTSHRLELKPFKNGSVMIDDAYNSNPEGCLEAVNVLSRFKDSFKVIITPGLVELGDREYDVNYSLGAHAAKAADVIIAVGKKRSEPIVKGALDSGFKKDNLFVADSFKNALEIFEPYAKSGTVLLVENDLPDNYLK
jgi:UDP-N-acetylmuramoyl-tripeptide--D-alanyl-D-alanine ligase